MSDIPAWQHVYANVEKSQSPRQQGGFQTLFYTHSGLTGAEVEEIETRLVYYSTDDEPVKRVFFRLSSGKWVLGQVVPLPEPDQAGRKGRYLAHSLILPPDALDAIGSHLFQIFREFPYFTMVTEALANGDFATGDIRPALVQLSPVDYAHEVKPAQLWPMPAQRKLTLAALRAGGMAREKLTVAIVGDSRQIEQALEAALLAVPTPLRAACSFDTHFYRCNLVATYFWAVGLPQPPTNPRLVVVDTTSRQVHDEPASQPETPYQRWALDMLDNGSFAAIAESRDKAFELCAWLAGEAVSPASLDVIPAATIASVFQVNADQVRDLLRRRLGEQAPSILASRLLEPIYRAATPTDLFRQLRGGFAPDQLLAVLYRTYQAQWFRLPPRDEVQAVGSLLQRADFLPMRLVYLCWAGRVEDLRRVLEELSEGEYRRFLDIALAAELLPPLSLFVSNHSQAFLDAYLRMHSDIERDLLGLAKLLLASDHGASLLQFTPYVASLPERDLHNLQKLLDDQPAVPHAFRDEVDAAVERVTATRPEEGKRSLRDRLPRWLQKD